MTCYKISRALVLVLASKLVVININIANFAASFLFFWTWSNFQKYNSFYYSCNRGFDNNLFVLCQGFWYYFRQLDYYFLNSFISPIFIIITSLSFFGALLGTLDLFSTQIALLWPWFCFLKIELHFQIFSDYLSPFSYICFKSFLPQEHC